MAIANNEDKKPTEFSVGLIFSFEDCHQQYAEISAYENPDNHS